jgi:hypothetical protein
MGIVFGVEAISGRRGRAPLVASRSGVLRLARVLAAVTLTLGSGCLRTVASDAGSLLCGFIACDPSTTVCVERDGITAKTYACELLPAACALDRTCACLSPWFCAGILPVCLDSSTANTISCAASCGATACAPAVEVCVEQTDGITGTTYTCEPVPAACASDRTCACLSSSFCTADIPIPVCLDSDGISTVNQIACAGQTTECGPGSLTCDTATEICVETCDLGCTWACELIPAGCEGDRDCSCARAALCTGNFFCSELAPNTLVCEPP